MRTLASHGLEQIPKIACKALFNAFNSVRKTRDNVFTSRAPPVGDDVMATNAYSLTAPLANAYARLKSSMLAVSFSCAVYFTRIFLFAP